jgi:putative FmdB family regulatory protein
MPIYAYRCAACGHTKDVLRKLSDPPLAICPVCGAQAFEKQVTAAGFQLKGSGWYATDFKNSGAAAKSSESESAKPADAKADAPSAAPVEGGKPADKPATKSPAPAAAAAASGSGAGTGTGSA